MKSVSSSASSGSNREDKLSARSDVESSENLGTEPALLESACNSSMTRPLSANTTPPSSVARTVHSPTHPDISIPLPRARHSACVFVASLNSNRTDDELARLVTNSFEKWGDILSIKVLRDTANRPYAFVQYATDQECNRAIELGHNSYLDARNIRCEHAKVNRTIFVKSPIQLTESHVRDNFDTFGEIEQMVATNGRGTRFLNIPGDEGAYNWVCKFVYRDDAIRAFANLPNAVFYAAEWAKNIERDDDRYFHEEKLQSLSEGVVWPLQSAGSEIDKQSIYVGQLRLQAKELEIVKRFEQHGRVAGIEIHQRRDSCFAFIRYASEISAASAVERENHAQFQGKALHVQYREIHLTAETKARPGIHLAPPPITKRFTNLAEAIVGPSYWKKPQNRHAPIPGQVKGNDYGTSKRVDKANTIRRPLFNLQPDSNTSWADSDYTRSADHEKQSEIDHHENDVNRNAILGKELEKLRNKSHVKILHAPMPEGPIHDVNESGEELVALKDTFVTPPQSNSMGEQPGAYRASLAVGVDGRERSNRFKNYNFKRGNQFFDYPGNPGTYPYFVYYPRPEMGSGSGVCPTSPMGMVPPYSPVHGPHMSHCPPLQYQPSATLSSSGGSFYYPPYYHIPYEMPPPGSSTYSINPYLYYYLPEDTYECS